ncbi:protein disulfide oxidoreductase [Helicovermis profundi]|uniref:Thioredoxin family protein n=1 Tax=Helicovermis profundi TaxID=3065157 RepID=A0AAU9EB36_9FIRM|nr:thioredoxin family protein [Clostridia bacterium S502]
MALLNEDIRKQLTEVFDTMKDEVTIALFTKKDSCDSCADTLSFMKEIEEIGSKIKLITYDIDDDSEKAKEYNVELTPAIVLLDHNNVDNGVKYNGIPAGHEINSLITGLLEVSGTGEALPEEMKKRVDAINKPIHIRVFVTLGCPHCPGAVSKAHKLALENKFVTAEMIEAQTFADLSDKYDVSGVPKIIINEDHDLVGNQPLEKFLEVIESL